MKNNSQIDKLIRSSIQHTGCLHGLYDILDFLDQERRRVKVNTKEVKLEALQGWSVDSKTGNLYHSSGGFFSIEGIEIRTNWGIKSQWQQPIINQPEIGFLGILVKEINGVLHFLMQAKIEPGNINSVQLSPTLQATKSNYSLKHKGKTPLYLEYFLDPVTTGKGVVILDQLQSEQGARFLKKRNRNIIIEVNEEIPLRDGFIWVSLGQIKELIKYDNIVNMDTRTVISGIQFNDCKIASVYGEFVKEQQGLDSFGYGLYLSAVDTKRSENSIEQLLSWVTHLKSKYELNVERIPLKNVKEWIRDDYSISHKDKKYFSVIGLNIEIENREVRSWCQPIVKSAQEGIIAFIVQRRQGIYHFLVQAKIEAGNFDVFELAPTIQCLTGNYRKGHSEYDVPFIDLVQEAENVKIHYKGMQSEEGGRFYREQNLNIIAEIATSVILELPENFAWFTLNQLLTLIKYNNYLNIQARSLLSVLNFA